MEKEIKELSLEEKLEQVLIPANEQPYTVPNNWCWVRLGNCVTIRRGASPRPINNYITDDSEGVNWIKIGDTDDSRYLSYTAQKVTKEGAKKSVYLEKGALILSNSMSFGRPYILRISGCIHDGWLSISNYEELFDINYLYFALLSSDWYFEKVAVGTAVRNLNSERVAGLPIILPPLTEQKRMVEQIEILLEKLDRAKDLVQECLDDLEGRRITIFEEAFCGDLTRKWRKTNQTNNNILEQVQQYYKDNNKVIKAIQKCQKSSAKFEKVKNSAWISCNIGAIAEVSNGSTPSRAIDEYWNGNIPWISSGEVKNNHIWETKEKITEKGFANSSVKLLPVGTVLIAMIGEGKTRGQSAILDIDAATNQNIAAIQVPHGLVSSEFIWYWLQYQYKRNRQQGAGTGPQALNGQRVRELDFILPPQEEQNEIVRLLNKLIGSEDNAKENMDILDSIDAIKKSILAKAFRGELSTTDLSEESSIELLKETLVIE